MPEEPEPPKYEKEETDSTEKADTRTDFEKFITDPEHDQEDEISEDEELIEFG